jgi:hypothetical protein
MEWQLPLRLLAIVTGKGAAADLHKLDDDLLDDDIRQILCSAVDAVIAALAGTTGHERLVDLALRGPLRRPLRPVTQPQPRQDQGNPGRDRPRRPRAADPRDTTRLVYATAVRARIAGGPRSIDVDIEITDDITPRVVSLPHSWGHALPGSRLGVAIRRPGTNLNALLDETLRDPLSGNAVLGEVPITMQPL